MHAGAAYWLMYMASLLQKTLGMGLCHLNNRLAVQGSCGNMGDTSLAEDAQLALKQKAGEKVHSCRQLHRNFVLRKVLLSQGPSSPRS